MTRSWLGWKRRYVRISQNLDSSLEYPSCEPQITEGVNREQLRPELLCLGYCRILGSMKERDNSYQQVKLISYSDYNSMPA